MGFKNTTKMTKGFRFPSSAGFGASTGKVQHVRGYTRAKPKKAYAKGGSVTKADCASAAKSAVASHVRAARPAGHGVGSFNKSPMIGK